MDISQVQPSLLKQQTNKQTNKTNKQTNKQTNKLCVTIFVVHKQCLISAHCSIVTVQASSAQKSSTK
jgi:hypothetical protein